MRGCGQFTVNRLSLPRITFRNFCNIMSGWCTKTQMKAQQKHTDLIPTFFTDVQNTKCSFHGDTLMMDGIWIVVCCGILYLLMYWADALNVFFMFALHWSTSPNLVVKWCIMTIKAFYSIILYVHIIMFQSFATKSTQHSFRKLQTRKALLYGHHTMNFISCCHSKWIISPG